MLARGVCGPTRRYVAKLPYLILNKRTALTRPLAKMILRHLTRRSNPTDAADELQEYKAEALTALQIEVASMQIWGKERSAGQQLTIERMRVHRVEIPTESSIALCAPGDALLRHFFLEVQEGLSEYQLSWRTQNVPMRVGSIDASMKRGKALADLNKRQTVRCYIYIYVCMYVCMLAWDGGGGERGG